MIVSGSFVIADWTAQAGTSREHPIVGLHLHRSDDEAWYVLEGRLGFQIGEEGRQIGAGESISVAPGTPHSWWNASELDALPACDDTENPQPDRSPARGRARRLAGHLRSSRLAMAGVIGTPNLL